MPRSVDPDRSHKTHSSSGRWAAEADEAVVVVGTFARIGMVSHSVAAVEGATVDGAAACQSASMAQDAVAIACAVGMDDADGEDRRSSGIDASVGMCVVGAWDVACMWRWWPLVDCCGR